MPEINDFLHVTAEPDGHWMAYNVKRILLPRIYQGFIFFCAVLNLPKVLLINWFSCFILLSLFTQMKMNNFFSCKLVSLKW